LDKEKWLSFEAATQSDKKDLLSQAKTVNLENLFGKNNSQPYSKSHSM